MNKRKIPEEHKLIIFCTRLQINSHIQQKIRDLLSNPIDWNKIIEISQQQQILPFLYYNLTKLNVQYIIPQDIFEIIKNRYYANLNRNLTIEKEIFLLSELTNRDGVSFIPLKGFSLIETLYHNPGLRIIADVDILIKKNEYRKIENILVQLGYRKNIRETSKKYRNEYRHMAIFSKILSPNLSIVIEIHGILAYARPYEIKVPYLWERTYKKIVNNQELLCLSPEDIFLSLILHLRSHTRRLNLKFIVDIAELLNINGDKFNWSYIIELARSNHILGTVYFSLYIVKELLNASVSPKILNEFRPNIIKDSLIRFTINKYNFFTLKKRQGTFLRFLLFDSLIDFILYLWRVSFLERFVNK